jgi:hypothetical protein
LIFFLIKTSKAQKRSQNAIKKEKVQRSLPSGKCNHQVHLIGIKMPIVVAKIFQKIKIYKHCQISRL